MTAYALIFINFPADATLDEVKHHCQSLPSTPTSWMRSHTDRITVIIFTNISHFTLRKLKNEREKGRKVSVENGKKIIRNDWRGQNGKPKATFATNASVTTMPSFQFLRNLSSYIPKVTKFAGSAFSVSTNFR